ncbi:Uncharacterized protein TPAR_07089, partial [Tolypocladium paradoxum]
MSIVSGVSICPEPASVSRSGSVRHRRTPGNRLAPPLGHRLRIPHSRKDILALILVLRVKHHLLAIPFAPIAVALLLVNHGHVLDGNVLPAAVRHHALHLEDVLADLVLLRLLVGVDVLPAQLARARRAADVGDDVPPGDELAVLAAADADVGERLLRGRRRRRDEERAPVAAREALGDDLRGQRHVRRAAHAAERVGRGPREAPGGRRGLADGRV